MLVLALDTSTALSVAGLGWISKGTGREFGQASSQTGPADGSPQGNRHVEELVPRIGSLFQPTVWEAEDEERCCPPGERAGEQVFTLADLRAVVVGLGPGPYTGLRIGIATAAAYGDALGIPVYGVCSLDALALGAWLGCSTGPKPHSTLVVSDAKRREVYWACYRAGRRVGGPGVAHPVELSALLGDFVPDSAAGQTGLLDGTDFAGLRRFGPPEPQPHALAKLVEDDVLAGEPPGPLTPLYLRAPDAKPPVSLAGAGA